MKDALKEMVYRFAPAGLLPPLRRAYGAVNALRHRGEAVLCPCCGRTFAQFLPSPVNGRPNCTCPRCGSAERHRLMALFLKQKTNLYTDSLRVLHIAPELPFMQQFKRLPNLDYVTADLVKGWTDLRLDVTQMDLPDASFDVVLCLSVLEHVPDDRKGMRELFRILRPGGWGIIYVPMDWNLTETLEDPAIATPEDRLRVYGHHDHKRLYGRDFKDRLEQAGFNVEYIPFAETFSETETLRYGFPGCNPIPLSRKPA